MSEGEISNRLEQEISQLEEELASRKTALEKQREEGGLDKLPTEKEILKEVIGQKINLSIPTQSQPPSAVQPPPIAELPSYLSEELKSKVQELVNTAFVASIDQAVKEAKATGNAALIDAFHDALVDELYNQLVERGKIEKV